MRKNFKDYLIITLGIILVAFSVEYFFIPNDLAAGGVTGFAIVINYYFPFLNTSILVLIMNLILFIVAFIFIGGNFGAKTIYAAFGLSLSLWIIESFLNPIAITKDLMLAAIFGTFISAIGMAMVFNANASTGGTDILAKILNKFFDVDIGKSLLAVDFIVTLLATVTFGVDVGLYALLSVMINGFTIDRIIDGFNSVKEVIIISAYWEEISQYIIVNLERGCTIFEGKGGFTKKDTSMIYTVVGRGEFIKLKKYIKEKDPKAFLTISESYEVLGEGFKSLY
ncbi:YitT family protein [Clostridium polynesiense]|uniref:YitT family protein n=1 Tax=Clostridium polynesiense TaxID=1325933 RepID=UPI0005907F4D|nr:YitT family protein [Clostridium polynesiense]